MKLTYKLLIIILVCLKFSYSFAAGKCEALLENQNISTNLNKLTNAEIGDLFKNEKGIVVELTSDQKYKINSILNKWYSLSSPRNLKLDKLKVEFLNIDSQLNIADVSKLIEFAESLPSGRIERRLKIENLNKILNTVNLIKKKVTAERISRYVPGAKSIHYKMSDLTLTDLTYINDYLDASKLSKEQKVKFVSLMFERFGVKTETEFNKSLKDIVELSVFAKKENISPDVIFDRLQLAEKELYFSYDFIGNSRANSNIRIAVSFVPSNYIYIHKLAQGLKLSFNEAVDKLKFEINLYINQKGPISTKTMSFIDLCNELSSKL